MSCVVGVQCETAVCHVLWGGWGVQYNIAVCHVLWGGSV